MQLTKHTHVDKLTTKTQISHLVYFICHYSKFFSAFVSFASIFFGLSVFFDERNWQKYKIMIKTQFFLNKGKNKLKRLLVRLSRGIEKESVLTKRKKNFLFSFFFKKKKKRSFDHNFYFFDALCRNEQTINKNLTWT